MNSPDPAKIQLFGLPAARGRWLLIPLGMALLLCLGTVCTWSVFRRPLEAELAIGATESLLPYTVALVCYATLMPIAGFYILKLGPRRIAALGGVVVGCGYLLASFSHHIATITLSYGVINGAGVGLAYGVPMAVLAVVFGVVIVAIASTLRLPPAAWIPRSAGSAKATQVPPGPGADAIENPTALRQLLRSRSFYGLWMGYGLAACVGLSAIGISGPVGEEIIQMSPGVAARSVALQRPVQRTESAFVWLAHRSLSLPICRHRVLCADPGGVHPDGACQTRRCGNLPDCLQPVLVLSGGGWLALAPTATLKLFDPKDYAMNYGMVFTAYGVGALLGTLVAGQLRDLFGSYIYAFFPMAALAICGIVVTSWLLKANGPQ
ncbi:MAG: MFS transporter [Cyanobium sp.]